MHRRATLYVSGNREPARAVLEEAVAHARRSDNELGASYALGYLALLHVDRGDVCAAERLASSALERSAEPVLREHFVTMVAHLARAKALEARGDLDGAEFEAARALELGHRGAGALEIASAELVLAEVRGSRGRDADALVESARARLSSCPDPGILGRLFAERAGRPVVDLTDRELAVVRLLDSDLSQREIGRTLFVSLNTVKTHMRGILRKLDAENRAEAVERARELGLI